MKVSLRDGMLLSNVMTVNSSLLLAKKRKEKEALMDDMSDKSKKKSKRSFLSGNISH